MASHHPEGEMFDKYRKMIKLLNIHLNHFPRHEKYALSQQIRNCAYEMFGLMIECRKRYHNKTSLRRLDVSHEQLRMFLNLAYELGYYNYKDGKNENTDKEANRRYTAVCVYVNELGAMIGGWLRSLDTSK